VGRPTISTGSLASSSSNFLRARRSSSGDGIAIRGQGWELR
jgi:hypothetical protein